MFISMREIVTGKMGSNEVETSVQSSALTNLKEQLLRNPKSHNQAITSSTRDQGKSGNDEVMAGLAQQGRKVPCVQASAGADFILGVVLARGC